MDDRKNIRPAAGLLTGGFVTYVVMTLLYTGGPANDHHVIFGDHAGSHSWGLVHLGRFAGMAVLVAGLLALVAALFSARDPKTTGAAVVARLGAVFGAVALGLYGGLQAADGVTLKQAVDAWVNAPESEQAARFASAETVRWLEWGTRSYHSLALGLALVLLGAAAAWSALLPRALGMLTVAAGLASLAHGPGGRFGSILRARHVRHPCRPCLDADLDRLAHRARPAPRHDDRTHPEPGCRRHTQPVAAASADRPDPTATRSAGGTMRRHQALPHGIHPEGPR